jgi:hypothetical protein
MAVQPWGCRAFRFKSSTWGIPKSVGYPLQSLPRATHINTVGCTPSLLTAVLTLGIKATQARQSAKKYYLYHTELHGKKIRTPQRQNH